MKDQVDALRDRGVPAGAYTAHSTTEERSQWRARLRSARDEAAVSFARAAADGPRRLRVPGDMRVSLVGDRRGALHQCVGPRLPARVPRLGTLRRHFRRVASTPTPPRHRTTSDRTSSNNCSWPVRKHWSAPSTGQSDVPGHTSSRRAAADSARAGPAPGRLGDHLLHHPQGGRSDRSSLHGIGLPRAALSRGDVRRRATPQPGGVH